MASLARAIRSNCPVRRLYTRPTISINHSFKRHLSLAYTLHEPAKDRAASKGDAIVIMHGLFGSKQNNRSISKALARDLGVRVYAVDLRNHGDSPHDATHTYDAMAADVEQFLDDHGLPTATLIGHSMGAKVAMTLALRSPHRVASLVPVDNAPVDAQLKSDFHKYVRGMRKILEAGVSRQSDADAILQEVESSLPIRQFLLTNLVREDVADEAGGQQQQKKKKKLGFRIPLKTLSAALDSMGDFPFRDPGVARYKGRTLFIRGTKSHYVADDVLPLIGQFFPAFQLADIDCGHWVISEQPEAFRKATVEFLQGKD